MLQYCYHGNLSLDLLSEMANFTHLACFLLCFCFVSKCVADVTAKGHKQSVSKIRRSDVRDVDEATLIKWL